MFAELVDQHCARLPGAEAEAPFGPDMRVWTVGGHMFAAYADDGRGVSVACADPDTARELVEAGKAVSAPYLEGPAWVLLPWDRADPEELRTRITDSYRKVRRNLPADVAMRLPPPEAATRH